MSQKLMPRLGSAIASTILSLFWGVLLVGVDKAQAGVLTYNIGSSSSLSFLKVDDSSLTGIGVEEIAVSEGRFYGYSLPGSEEYNDLAGASALFVEGNFRGLNTSLWDSRNTEIILPGESAWFLLVRENLSMFIETPPSPFPSSPPSSAFFRYYEKYITERNGTTSRADRQVYQGSLSYFLVDTEAEPVPEPLTAGGTALALAGLSWLKHKKKMAA
jgi:hypothetical protein